VVVSNAVSATSNPATLTVSSTPLPQNVVDVVTYHNDLARTGQKKRQY
jgi:hypothetical protein